VIPGPCPEDPHGQQRGHADRLGRDHQVGAGAADHRYFVLDGEVYRLYAEFMPTGRADNRHPLVLGVPFVVAGDTRYDPLPEPVPAVDLGGLTVSRVGGAATAAAGRPDVLRFRVADAGGAPVGTLRPYLGTYAHVSAFHGDREHHPSASHDDGRRPRPAGRRGADGRRRLNLRRAVTTVRPAWSPLRGRAKGRTR
jgi:hypothetical protein